MKTTKMLNGSGTRGRAWPLLVSLAALAPGCASFEGWNAVKTKHFTVYTTSSQYKETLRALEQGYAALSSSFFKGTEVGSIDVLFLGDAEFVGQFGSYRKGAALAKVPGNGTIGKDGLLVVRPWTLDGSGDGMDRVNMGEGSSSAMAPMINQAGLAANEMLPHIFIQRAMPKAPLWFHEGFSTYVRNLAIKQSNDQTFGCFGYVQAVDPHMGLAKIWNVDFEGYGRSDARGWFRSTSHMLIDYVIHGDDNAHRGKLAALVGGVSSGEASDKVVTGAFEGKSIDEIDKALLGHRENVKQLLSTRGEVRGMCPFGIVIPPEKKPEDPVAEQSSAVPAADIESLFRALDALPGREEYPPYYPAEVIAKVKVPPKG